MSIVLLRDDFTGSGSMVGRIPDGANNGAWIDYPYQIGTAVGTSSVAGGVAKATTGNSWSVEGPLSGAPSDAYMEVGVKNSGYTGAMQFGVRSLSGAHSGIFVEIDAYTATTGGYSIWSSPGTGYLASGTNTFANAASFVARLEITGNAIKLYIDGTLIASTTLVNVVPGGNAYLGLLQSVTSIDYVEAGSLVVPPTPLFWTTLRGVTETP